jgi:DHA2 family multidrug resistance protein-like MFS transporter
MQPHQGLPYPQRVWAILTVFCGLIMAVLDGSIANIALPSISRELNAEAASTIWVVNAYQLTVTVCLLPLSSLGDILGYKRVYRTGLAIFLIGSLIAACAVNLPMLVAARVIQGIGGAGIMSVNTALVRFIYPPTKLGRGIGLNALVVGVTIAVGPSLGALILGISSWQWLFAVNVRWPSSRCGSRAGRCLIHRPSRARSTIPAPCCPQWSSACLSSASTAWATQHCASLARSGLRWPSSLAGCWYVGNADVRYRPVREPRLHAGCRHIVLLVHDADARVRSLAVLSRVSAWTQPAGNRLADHPLAADGRLMAALSGRLSDRYPASILAGAGLIMLTTGLIGLALLANRQQLRYRLAHRAVRHRLRLLPVPEQPGDDRRHAT